MLIGLQVLKFYNKMLRYHCKICLEKYLFDKFFSFFDIFPNDSWTVPSFFQPCPSFRSQNASKTVEINQIKIVMHEL